MISGNITSNVQRIYDDVVVSLSSAERLRLVELITRGLAQPEAAKDVESPAIALQAMPGWQVPDRRGGQSEWRDRAL